MHNHNPDAMRSYVMIANHPGDKFNPFDPDPAGALREVYAWIASPELLTPTHATYRVAHYNQLTEMLRRAIKNAESIKETAA